MKSQLKQQLEELKYERSLVKKDSYQYAYLTGRIEQIRMDLVLLSSMLADFTLDILKSTKPKN